MLFRCSILDSLKRRMNTLKLVLRHPAGSALLRAPLREAARGKEAFTWWWVSATLSLKPPLVALSRSDVACALALCGESCGHRRARAGTDKAEVEFEFDKRRTVFELAAVVAKHSDLTVGSFRL